MTEKQQQNKTKQKKTKSNKKTHKVNRDGEDYLAFIAANKIIKAVVE